MNPDDLLEPYNGSLSVTRKQTELSKLSESIVVAFLRKNAISAGVKHECTGFEIHTLYKGLRNVCCKSDFKNLVRVTKRGDTIILARIKK